MNPLESARHLQAVIFSSSHYERVRPTVDGKDLWSSCVGCEESWPCTGSKILKAAEALPQIIAALEDAS